MCRVTILKLIVFFSTRSTTISGVGQSKINWITAQLFNTGLMTYMSLILWVYNSKIFSQTVASWLGHTQVEVL